MRKKEQEISPLDLLNTDKKKYYTYKSISLKGYRDKKRQSM